MSVKEQYYTDYHTAVHWCGDDLVLCNNIADVDPSVYDNFRFELGEEKEIFQWYITNASEESVEYLEKTFGLLYTYSNLLDCFILCVDHFGAHWSYVPCEVFSESWIACTGDKFKFKH